jgi:uncharacterized membrane protein YphA (DoxX/SURF4 family)
MVQIFWLIDFFGLFLGRIILALFLFSEATNQKNKFRYLYFILSASIFLGYYSSFAFFWLFFQEIFSIIYFYFYQKENFKNLEFRFLRVALALVYLVVGPGSWSADYILNIRF